MGLERGMGGQGSGCGTRKRVATWPTRTPDLITRIGARVGHLWILHACAALMAAPLWGAQLIH